MFSNTKLLVASNTVSQIAGRVLTSSASLIISLIIANRYGAAGYGDFIKITTFLAVFYLLADFGMNAVYLRDRVYSWPVLLTTRVIVSLLFMFVASGVLIFLPNGITNGYTPFIKFGIFLFIPSILFQAIITTQNAVFQQHMKYHLATIAGSIGAMFPVLLIWIGIRIFLPDTSILFCVLSVMAGMMITVMIGLAFARKFIPVQLVWDVTTIRNLLMASIPLGLTLVCNVIYFRADSFILTLTRSTSEVGIYGLAYKFFEFPLAIPTFFMNAVYPVLLSKTGESADDRIKYRNIIRQSMYVLLGSSLLIMVLVRFGAPYLNLIKADFRASVYPLQILSLGYPFFFLSGLFMWCLITLKKHGILIGIYGGSMIVNILANIFYIPRYGYPAAGWITVISEMLICVVSGYLVFVTLKKIHI